MTGMDLTSNSEKSEIRVFCDKAFSRLKGSDKNLPQVNCAFYCWDLINFNWILTFITPCGCLLQVVRVQNLLRRGIGVHHAGLLPIVKEVVEMLFCRGVIKVDFHLSLS